MFTLTTSSLNSIHLLLKRNQILLLELLLRRTVLGWHCIPSSLFNLFYSSGTKAVGCHRVSSHRDSTGLSLPRLRNNYLSRSASSENERGLRLPVRSLNGARKGARNGRILRDAILRLRQQKGPRKADPWLRSCGGKGESKPERVVGQARGSCLCRWSVLPANSWHANIDYVLPYQRTLPPIPPPCSRIFLFIFFSLVHSKRHDPSRKSHNRNCVRSSAGDRVRSENLMDEWRDRERLLSQPILIRPHDFGKNCDPI